MKIIEIIKRYIYRILSKLVKTKVGLMMRSALFNMRFGSDIMNAINLFFLLGAKIKTPWGFLLISDRTMVAGEFEVEETKIFRNIIKDIDVFVNIGAHKGYYCCHALSMGKNIVAFEPSQENVRYLLKNICDNKWSNKAIIFPTAVGDVNSITSFWDKQSISSLVKDWHGIPRNRVSLVPVVTLDTVKSTFYKKKSLILMDVEGYEYNVLLGAKDVLSSIPAPIWIVEIFNMFYIGKSLVPNPHFEKTFDVFFDNGYQAYTADEKTTPITRDIVKKIVEESDDLCTGNYLFRKK